MKQRCTKQRNRQRRPTLHTPFQYLRPSSNFLPRQRINIPTLTPPRTPRIIAPPVQFPQSIIAIPRLDVQIDTIKHLAIGGVDGRGLGESFAREDRFNGVVVRASGFEEGEESFGAPVLAFSVEHLWMIYLGDKDRVSVMLKKVFVQNSIVDDISFKRNSPPMDQSLPTGLASGHAIFILGLEQSPPSSSNKTS